MELHLNGSESLNGTSTLNASCGPTDLSLENQIPTSMIIGILVTIGCFILTGFSLSIRKKALIIVALNGSNPAAEGGLGYLKSALWWLGFALTAISQIGVGVCLNFVPAIIVSPLGVLNIASSAMGGRWILKEKIGVFGWVGCCILMIGIAMFAIIAPKELDLKTTEDFVQLLVSINFISFYIVIFLCTIVLLILAPKYGSRHILIYAFISGAAGTLLSWLTKGILIFVSTGVFDHWLLWVSIAINLSIILFHLYYMHILLHLYETSAAEASVTVIMSTLIVSSSSFIFPIQYNITLREGFLMAFSFTTIVLGLFVLNFGKHVTVNFKEILLKEVKYATMEGPTETDAKVNCGTDNEMFRKTEE
ncbi:magnesium transporter NIPA3 [Hyalella azteca]|uniref:Magnesium transporter NIPA3 n=1 Tax=Hyalella azteca TaxID=294128 RepID=A0A8B7PC43_HYAAZ|nr:magnesium transporter NIPA3 [Hyalella azteca]XP_018023734.1 magnesium transporter NIPA3 [Hyalella azteca]